MNDEHNAPLLDKAIFAAIRAEIERVTKEEIARAQGEIERAVRARAGEIVTTIFRRMDFERCGDSLRIRVEFPWKDTAP